MPALCLLACGAMALVPVACRQVVGIDDREASPAPSTLDAGDDSTGLPDSTTDEQQAPLPDAPADTAPDVPEDALPVEASDDVSDAPVQDQAVDAAEGDAADGDAFLDGDAPGPDADADGGIADAGDSGDCTDQQRDCVGATPRLCNAAGEWVDQPPCADPNPLCSEGLCAPATPDLVSLPLPDGGTFGIDETEVTRAQYEAWLTTAPPANGQTGVCTSNTMFAPDAWCMSQAAVCQDGCGNHPQVCVDWCDAVAYCRAFGKRLCGGVWGGTVAWTGYASEAASQWFRACSSAAANDYTYPGAYQAPTCNVDNPSLTTSEVGGFPGCHSTTPGYAGVFDLTGNVWEWEDSCTVQSGLTVCRLRGGSYQSSEVTSRCGYPHSGDHKLGYPWAGFRCCKD